MKRLDEGKVSLVDFLRSIKYSHHSKRKKYTDESTHFAGFNPQTPAGDRSNTEDAYLVRSAN
jgi:hypothetical protein